MEKDRQTGGDSFTGDMTQHYSGVTLKGTVNVSLLQDKESTEGEY